MFGKKKHTPPPPTEAELRLQERLARLDALHPKSLVPHTAASTAAHIEAMRELGLLAPEPEPSLPPAEVEFERPYAVLAPIELPPGLGPVPLPEPDEPISMEHWLEQRNRLRQAS